MRGCKSVPLSIIVDQLAERCNNPAQATWGKDHIHGEIRFEEELPCKTFGLIISLPIFRRLMEVYQLGLTYEFFPGARHTRYEHSVGVGYLAYRALKYLLANSENCQRTEGGFECSVEGDMSVRFDERDYAIVLVLGLLHDIGHAHYGHLLDFLVPSLKRWYDALYEKFGIETQDWRLSLVGFGLEDPKFDTALLLYLLHNCDVLRNALNFIGSRMIVVWENLNFTLTGGKPAGEKKPVYTEFAKFIWYIYAGEEVSAFPILEDLSEDARFKIDIFRKIYTEGFDVDRIDYLLRDIHQLGARAKVEEIYREEWNLLSSIHRAILTSEKSMLGALRLSRHGGRAKMYLKDVQDVENKLREIINPIRRYMYEQYYEMKAKALVDMAIYRLVYTGFYCFKNFINTPNAFNKTLLEFLSLPTLRASEELHKLLSRYCNRFLLLKADRDEKTLFITRTMRLMPLLQPHLVTLIAMEFQGAMSQNPFTVKIPLTNLKGEIELINMLVIDYTIEDLLQAYAFKKGASVLSQILLQDLNYCIEERRCLIDIPTIENQLTKEVSTEEAGAFVLINFYTFKQLLQRFRHYVPPSQAPHTIPVQGLETKPLLYILIEEVERHVPEAEKAKIVRELITKSIDKSLGRN